MINQARINKAAEAAGDKNFRPIYNIYVAIGQKQSSIARVIGVLEEAGAMPYTLSSLWQRLPIPLRINISRRSPVQRLLNGSWTTAWTRRSFMMILSQHAVAYRQVALILKRPSGREAYPGDVFYLHSRLLERSARVSEKIRQWFFDRAANY